MQQRCKWQGSKPDLKPGDLVLLIDDQSHRNHWPMGLVINAIPSKDGKIRATEVRVNNEGKQAVYTRPISKMVLLISEN